VGAVAIGLALAVALQRHLFTSPSPGAVLVVVAVLPWVLALLGGDHPPSTSPPALRVALWSAVVMGATFGLILGYRINIDFAPFFLVMLAGAVTSEFGFRYGVGVGLAIAAVLASLDSVGFFGGSVIWIAAIVVSVLGGAAVRNQVIVATELRAAQTDLADRVAAEERRRLARDIHDLIAHSLAVTMLHLTGARVALKDGDSDEALEALDEAERTGREAMSEIRRAVGLLGPAGSGPAAPPTPKAADLPALVGDFRAAGLEVDLDLSGSLDAIPLTPGLALYRIVQESLSNVVKHAPGRPARLAVEVTDGIVRATVTNPLPVAVGSGYGVGATAGPRLGVEDKRLDGDPRAAGDAGHGVRGMTERAQVLQGTLRAGPQAECWTMEATIPMRDSES
jgi:signal transduction histidine kinase